MRNFLLLLSIPVLFVFMQGQEGMSQLAGTRALQETCPGQGIYIAEFPGLRAATRPLNHPCPVTGSGSVVQ